MKLQLIDDWRKAWKLASVWVFGLVTLFPDAYDAIAAMGWMDELPDPAKWSIRALGAMGVIARVLARRKPPC
ncbi:hypothetical protein JAK47_06470 [Stenotrophomonas maltophilia]|uniref:DUF7940 domain-containing protein n=1 Tax=Stenotrophomonas maltophilia TaxID=40324 RepID=UPI0021C88386|nr:hypothetical protein [Stenotrophomonas maltophilia]MCU1054178.1 hypothetical protein [Stenotrophomonas maltophilia]MCU1160339.1 hypothetical protein [Stenotrophomonas maltophilia]